MMKIQQINIIETHIIKLSNRKMVQYWPIVAKSVPLAPMTKLTGIHIQIQIIKNDQEVRKSHFSILIIFWYYLL